MKKLFKQTLAIDFDGTCHKYEKPFKWGECDEEPHEGCIESIRKLAIIYNIVILTCRTDFDTIKDWFEENNFPIRLYQNIEVTNIKPQAIVYLDDRAEKFSSWDNFLKKYLIY